MRTGVDVSATLPRLMSLLGLSRRAMARVTGLEWSRLRTWEQGKRPTLNVLRQGVTTLAAALELNRAQSAAFVERVLAFLEGRVESPWDGDPPPWRDGRNPTRRAGRPPMAETELANAHTPAARLAIALSVIAETDAGKGVTRELVQAAKKGDSERVSKLVESLRPIAESKVAKVLLDELAEAQISGLGVSSGVYLL